MELYYLANFCENYIMSVVVDIFYSIYNCTYEPTNINSAAIKTPASASIVEDSGTDIQQAPTTNGKHNRHVTC